MNKTNTAVSSGKKPEFFLRLKDRGFWKVENRQMFHWDRVNKKWFKVANSAHTDSIDVIRNSGEYLKIENIKED